MSGWIVLVVGVVLCFLGVGSVHLAVLASSFGAGWLLADLFNASTLTCLIVAAATAVIVWVVVTLVFKFARFLIGLITGTLIGSRLAALFELGKTSWIIVVILVVATALVFGFLADRYRGRALLWATSIGGAGLILSSLGLIWPNGLGFLRHPNPGTQQITSTLLWIALSVAGWLVQRRLFAKKLNLEDRDRAGARR